MKNKYLLLLKMQLYNFFGINRILHSHSKKEKKRGAAVVVLAIIAVGVMLAYSTAISVGLANMRAINIVPTISVLICSLVTLILTFLKSSGVLVGLRDYDMVMSLPVNSLEVVLSRLTFVYLSNLLISIIVVLPAVIVFGIYAETGTSASIIFLLSLVFLPVIPMIISLGLGVLIAAVSSQSRHKNVLSLVLSTFVVLLIVAASTLAQNRKPDEILDIGLTLSNMANRIYPPAALISKAVESQNFLYFFIFIGMTVLIGGAFVGIVSLFYQKMNTAAFSHCAANYEKKTCKSALRTCCAERTRAMPPAACVHQVLVPGLSRNVCVWEVMRHKYEGRPLKVSSPLKAMYKREFDRYFSCTIYALNSTIGMVLLLVVSLLLLFISPEMLEQQSGIIGLSVMLHRVLPLVITVFITMTSTTSASLSLEGKSRWIMCSVPVRAIDIFHAKIAVNLTVICPFVLISALLSGIKMEVSLIQAVLLCIVPAVYACFISVLGMYMNVKFPKYDWTSEYHAVKGGAISVLATMGTGMLSSVIPLLICAAFQDYSGFVMLVTSFLLLTVSFVLYGRLRRYQLYEI